MDTKRLASLIFGIQRFTEAWNWRVENQSFPVRHSDDIIARKAVHDLKERPQFAEAAAVSPPVVPGSQANDRQFAKLRACLKIQRGPVFAEKAAWRGAMREHTPAVSVTEEQRSQAAFSAKTLRAAVLLAAACVGSVVTARCGDAPTSPPWPHPKCLAAGPFSIFRQALSWASVLSI